MARPRNLTLCSFCGKSHAEVRKLVSGPGVYICDGCVETFKQVLDKELAEETPKAETPQLAVKQPVEIKAELDKHCIGQDAAKKTLAVAWPLSPSAHADPSIHPRAERPSRFSV